MPIRSQTERTAWRRFAREVLVERRRFSRSTWAPHFKRLRRAIQEHHSILATLGAPIQAGGIDPRELLLWSWCALMAMPEAAAQRYAALDESNGAESGIHDGIDRLRDRNYAFSGLDTSPEMQARWLGTLVRAIDADLAGIDFWPKRGQKWQAKDWQPTGYPCYVVPVRREYRLGAGKERERRATRYHAIVPAQLGDLEICLALHPEVVGAADTRPWLYGAAIFDNLSVEYIPVGEAGFVLTGAPANGAAGVIRDQIQEALAAGCDTLVWPELTIPIDRLALIQAELGVDPLASKSRIPLVVAGSWHLAFDGGYINQAPILASRGDLLATCDKRREFPFRGLREAIDPGRVVPVIVMEDRLVGVAICRDFCDDCADDIYSDLGLDLVLVPSMGEASTVEAHERHCKALQSKQGAVSVVVQQTLLVSGESLAPGLAPAYSFARPRASETDAAQTVPFRPLESRR